MYQTCKRKRNCAFKIVDHLLVEEAHNKSSKFALGSFGEICDDWHVHIKRGVTITCMLQEFICIPVHLPLCFDPNTEVPGKLMEILAGCWKSPDVTCPGMQDWKFCSQDSDQGRCGRVRQWARQIRDGRASYLLRFALSGNAIMNLITFLGDKLLAYLFFGTWDVYDRSAANVECANESETPTPDWL